MKNNSKFFLNFLILILIVGVFDQLSGRILRYFYFRQTSGLNYRTIYAMDSTVAEILVFGSSRANHHYVPEIFEEKFQMQFYNSGREGNFLLYNSAVFKAVIKRYTPKIVVFDVWYNELYYEKSNYDRLSSLLPYYRDHPEVWGIIQLRSPFEKLKLISEIYPFNSGILTVITGNLRSNRSRKSDTKGYVPLWETLQDTVLRKFERSYCKIDTNTVKAVEEIIECCRKNKIELLLVQSPVFGLVEKTLSMDFIEKLAEQNNIAYFDFSNSLKFIENPQYFQDNEHLNDNGAKCFSTMIVQQIEDCINRNYLVYEVPQNNKLSLESK